MTITLTTDFGGRDGYVGALKGVLRRYAPHRVIVDVAHDLPRGDVAHAAWVVRSSCFEFPKETLHVVVVDPGVGGRRQGVIVLAGGHVFVGPDNGVFAYLPEGRAFAIDLAEVQRLSAGQATARHPNGAPISATFHGRDVFAPVAGALAQGKKPQKLGSETRLAGALPWGARPRGEGRVVHIDHFGNLITDLPAEEAGSGSRSSASRSASRRPTRTSRRGACSPTSGLRGRSRSPCATAARTRRWTHRAGRPSGRPRGTRSAERGGRGA